jgi:hypothetical protein
MILYIHQNFNDDIISTIGKIETRRVKQYQKKVTHDKRSESHEQSKDVGAHLPLSRLCDPLQSLLIIFHRIAGFVSSKSFQRY